MKEQVHNFFVLKSKVHKDGDINHHVIMYLSDEAGYDDFTIRSVSVCNSPMPDDGKSRFMITVLVDDVKLK